MKCAIRLVIMLLAFISTSAAQPLTVEMKDLDFRGLPRITFSACVSQGDTLLPALDASNFTLTENGIPQIVTMRCPEAGQSNSVILVLDNSGSIRNVLPKLVEAGSILVDSLGVNDEAAVMTFNQRPTLRQDFTLDKAALKAALVAMDANGGTAIWDASYEACMLLAPRPGKKFAVILTDGDDQSSTLQTVDPIIQLANSMNARLFTIAFNITGSEAATKMQRIANETGGFFFNVERPSELTAVYEEIASVITEPCCIGEYISYNCEDSVRTIRLTVDANGNTAFDEATEKTPFRPKQMRLRVDVPDVLTPQQSGTGYIYLDPPPDPNLELTMSFTLEYDNDLIDITPALPLSLATITQNQAVSMVKSGPNEMQFSMERIKPALLTNRLVGFPVQALRDDSVWIVEFSILAQVNLEGCPSTFTLEFDTTIICPCFTQVDVDLTDKEIAFPGMETEFHVFIPRGLSTEIAAELFCEIGLPPGFELISIENGALFSPEDIQWHVMADEWIRVEVPGYSLPLDTAGLLITMLARTPMIRSAQEMNLDFRNTTLLQRCCPSDPEPYSTTIFVDGLCDKVVRRRAAATVAVSPNPVRGSGGAANIQVKFNSTHTGGDYRLILVDVYGKEVQTIAEQEFLSGEYSFAVDTSLLPSGIYKAVLINDKERVSDTMIIIR